MDAGGAVSQEVGGLGDGMGHANVEDSAGGALVLFEKFEERGGEGGSAHFNEAFGLANVLDRHDAGDDRLGDAEASGSTKEFEVVAVIEEKLGDEEVDTGVGFKFEILEIHVARGGAGMGFGVASGGDTGGRIVFFDEGDEFVGELAGAVLRTSVRGVSAQGEDVEEPFFSHVPNSLVEFVF